MISVLADQSDPAELVDAVRDASESFDLNHQGLVFISPLSRIYVEGEVDAPGTAAGLVARVDAIREYFRTYKRLEDPAKPLNEFAFGGSAIDRER